MDNNASSQNESVLRSLLAIKPNGYTSLDYDGFCKLSANPCDVAVDWLLENPGHIVYYDFCMNENNKAIDFLFTTFNKCSWHNKIFPGALHKNKNRRAQKIIDIFINECGFANRKECIKFYAEQKNMHLDI